MISRRAVRERCAVIAACAALMGLMNVIYVRYLVGVLSDSLGGPGYPFTHRSFAFAALCWAAGLAPLTWLPLKARHPSDVFTWCIYLMVFLPTALIGSYADQPAVDIIQMLMGFTIGLLILNGASRLTPIRLPAVRASRGLFWAIIVMMSVAAYGTTVRTYGTVIKLVSLNEVYTQRAAFAEIGGSLLARYLLTWQALTINPLLMAFGMARRRPLLFLAALLGQLFLFAVAAQRVLLATPLIVVGFHFFLRRGGNRFGLKASVASLAAFVAPIYAFLSGGIGQILALLLFDGLLNRLFLNSGFLSVLYFKYFINHPYVGFSQTKPLSFFLSSPYSVSYPTAIGYDLWGEYNNVNANFFADGFAQLGYTGLVIETVILAGLLWLLNCVARQRSIPVWIVAMACAGQIVNIVNSSISTFVMGEGFGLMLLLLAIMPRFEATGERVARQPVDTSNAAVPAIAPA